MNLHINWINNLIYKNRNLKLTLLDLKIPGTFDSGNYTKHVNIFLQFCNGIRFLDINIGYELLIDKERFFVSDKYGNESITLLELFKDIMKFMIKYKDPIILNINYLNIKKYKQCKFEQLIQTQFYNYLVTSKDIFNINIGEMPLSQLLSKNKKLIVLTEQGTFINKTYCNFTTTQDEIIYDVTNMGSIIKRLQCFYDKKNNHTSIYKILNESISSKINIFLIKLSITCESINSINQIILSNY